MFFTVTNPMDDDHGTEETPCDLTKTTIAPYKKTLAQQRGLQFYQTRSHAVVLYNTLPAVRIEKAVCMKTKEELRFS